jgi:hypothetical protein
VQVEYKFTVLIIASLALGACMKNGDGGGPGLQNVLLIGEVVSEKSEKQVPQALVVLKKGDNAFVNTYTDPSGKFRFDELPSGEFDLVVTKGDKYAEFSFNKQNNKMLDAAEFANGRQFLRVAMKAEQTTIKSKIISEALEEVVDASIKTYPPTVEVQSNAGGVFELSSDLFEEGIIYSLQITHPDYDAKQYKVEKILIAQENVVPTIEVKPRLKIEGIDGDDIHHDDGGGIAVPGSGN